MRKFILITAMVLVSATAQAAEPRGLTLASNEDPLAATPAQAVDPKPADAKPVDAKPLENQPVETPKYVDRPAGRRQQAATVRRSMPVRGASHDRRAQNRQAEAPA